MLLISSKLTKFKIGTLQHAQKKSELLSSTNTKIRKYQKARNKRQARGKTLKMNTKNKTEKRPEKTRKTILRTHARTRKQTHGEETDELTKSSNTNLINQGMSCRWRQC